MPIHVYALFLEICPSIFLFPPILVNFLLIKL